MRGGYRAHLSLQVCCCDINLPLSVPSIPTLLLQGADALVVRIDTKDTPEGSKDLWAVTQAVKVPVLARDWCIHPLQVGRGHSSCGRWLLAALSALKKSCVQDTRY